MKKSLSIEEQKLIQKTYDELKSIQLTIKKLKYNYRTIVKYINNKPNKTKGDPKDIVKVYMLVGSLDRVAKIFNISTTTVWRKLKSQNIIVGKGTSTWRRLYNTLRARVSRSDWRKYILERDDYKCTKCNCTSNIVHHIIKLSDLRDNIITNYPNLDPFRSFKELRQFTNLVMSLHKVEDGIVLCYDCHDEEHSKKRG